MTAVGRESARRHDADGHRSLPSLTDIAETVLAEPNEQVLEAMYFETVGLDRAHTTVRNRGAGWTLKLPVAEDNHDEVRVERTDTIRVLSSPGLCGR